MKKLLTVLCLLSPVLCQADIIGDLNVQKTLRVGTATAGTIAPAQITSDQDDYAPTGYAAAFELLLSTDAARTLTGLAAGADKEIKLVTNTGSFDLVLADESGSSTEENRFDLADDVTVGPHSSVLLRYYAGAVDRWRVIGGAGGGGGGSVTDAAAVHVDVAAEISGVANKATPVVGDYLLIEDSADSDAKKSITIGSLETALEGILDLPDLQGVLTGAKGGTNAANTGRTITVAGDFTLSGANSLTLTTTGTTSLTLPTSGTLLSDAAAVTVPQGGTGRVTGTTAYGLIAAGTTATGAQQTLAAGTTGQILVGGGASALPVWTTATGTGAPVRADSPTFTTAVTVSGNLDAGTIRAATATGVKLISSDANGVGFALITPSGTATQSNFILYAGADTANTNFLNIKANTGETHIDSGKAGTGTAQALNLKVSGFTIASLTSSGLAVTGVISTSAPSGGTSANWKLGTVDSVTLTSPNRSVEVEVGGTTLYIPAKTTKD